MRSQSRLFLFCGLVSAFASGFVACGKDRGPSAGGAEGGQGGEPGAMVDGSGGTPMGEGGEGGTSDGYDAFDAFREMQQSLRQSPDHLIARAATLVAERDAEGLFELVRDDIAAIPGPEGFYGAGTARRFGARAALRGGMGTLRERADLLRDLLMDAGFQAAVHVGAPTAEFDVDGLLEHTTNRTFSPESSAADRQRWASVLPPVPEDFSVSPLDQDGALVAQVKALLDEAGVSASAATSQDFEVNELPFVRAEIDGDAIDLNPNVKDAQWDESYVQDAEPAPDGGPLVDVTLRLGLARSSAPDVELSLIEQTFSADELVGRTVTASFSTQHSLLEALATPAHQAQTFIPTFQVRGSDLNDEEAEQLSVVGTAFTRGGQVIEVDTEGSLVGDERAALPPSDASLLETVDDVSIQLDTSAFPEVSILVSLTDENGELVSGLAADAFSVQDGGDSVPAVLRRSELPPPNVVLLFDRSSSLPSEFLDDVAATGRQIADSLFSAVPGLAVQIVGMDINGPSVAGGFVTTLDEVDLQLGMLSGAASEVWTNLNALSESPADIIVLISDFVADDAPTPEIERALAAGPPVLTVAVGSADTDVADRVAELTSGSRFDGVDAAGVAARSAEFAAEQARYTYRIVYRADEGAPFEREVRLSVDGERLVATANYEVPEFPAPLPAISGIFLTISSGGREVRRLLAGTVEAEPSAAKLSEADAMLFGRVVLGVEGGPPSLSVNLDEHIGERLKLERLVDAANANDRRAVLSALASSRTRTPADLRFAFAAGPDEVDGPATYPEGVSMALYVERPIWNEGIRRSLDWLPLAPRRTALRDPQEAFFRTLVRTAYLAAIEATRFPESTLSLMGDQDVGIYDALTIDASLGPEWYPPVQSYPGRVLVAPTSGDPLTFFAIDPSSGDIIGGLPDATGGAVAQDVEQTLQQIDTILNVAERAGELGGFNGIKVWTDLERTKAQLVGSATILLGEGGPEPDIPGAVGDAISSAAEDAITDEIPGYDDVFGPAGDLGDLYDGVEAFSGQEMPDVPTPSF